MNVDLTILKRGLDSRILMLRSIVSNAPMPSFQFQNRSLARDYFLSRHNSSKRNVSDTSYDIYIARHILRSTSIEARIQVQQSFADLTQTAYLTDIVVGAIMEGDLEFSPDEIVSAIDYSLFMQTALSRDQVKGQSDQLASEFSRFYDKAYAVLGISKSNITFRDLEAIARKFGKPIELNGLGKLKDALGYLKETAWFVFGIDFFTALELLVDIDFRSHLPLKEPLVRSVSIARLGYLFSRLRYLTDRLNFADEYNFEGYEGEVAKQFPCAALDFSAVERRLEGKSKAYAWRRLDAEYFSLALGISRELASCISNGNHMKACRCLMYLYELDPDLIAFLNWQYIYNGVPAYFAGSDLVRAFSSLLFMDEAVRRSYPELSQYRGLGSFMGAFSSYLDEQRARNIGRHGILSGIRSQLSPRSAELVCSSVLEKSNFDRLARKFPPVRLRSPDFEPADSDDSALMELRLRLAFSAERLKLLSEDMLHEIFSNERDALKLRKFHGEMKRGRIRVAWDHVHATLTNHVALVSGHLLVKSSSHAELKSNDPYVAKVLDFTAEDVVCDLLFHGVAAFDNLLGDNLRHSVIGTRYASAFNRALTTAYGRRPGQTDWEDERTQLDLGSAYMRINQLREFVLLSVDQYMDYWLTITFGGKLFLATKSAIVRELSRRIDAQSLGEESAQIATELTSEIENCFTDFINWSRLNFDKAVVEPTLFELSNVRAECNDLEAIPTVFFDSLQDELTESGTEIRNWIKVVVVDSDFEDFAITDLVNVELNLLYLSKPGEMNVSCRHLVHLADGTHQKIDSVIVRGKYFEPINEIVHNLISNAVKHSGMGMRTHLMMDFIIDGQDILIVARNNMTPEALIDATRKFEQAIALSRGELITEALDNLSGFQKISRVCYERSRINPEIKIQKLTRTTRTYTVTVKIPDGAGVLLSDVSTANNR